MTSRQLARSHTIVYKSRWGQRAGVTPRLIRQARKRNLKRVIAADSPGDPDAYRCSPVVRAGVWHGRSHVERTGRRAPWEHFRRPPNEIRLPLRRANQDGARHTRLLAWTPVISGVSSPPRYAGPVPGRHLVSSLGTRRSRPRVPTDRRSSVRPAVRTTVW